MAFHWFDMLPILAIGILFFGPKKLPEMGASFGKTIREFQRSMNETNKPTPSTAQPEAAPTAMQETLPASENAGE